MCALDMYVNIIKEIFKFRIKDLTIWKEKRKEAFFALIFLKKCSKKKNAQIHSHTYIRNKNVLIFLNILHVHMAICRKKK